MEVIPWAVADSNWVCAEGGGAWGGDAAAGAPTGSVRLEPTRTVFVGALHGILSASALATIMNDLFGGVVYAGPCYAYFVSLVLQDSEVCSRTYSFDIANTRTLSMARCITLAPPAVCKPNYEIIPLLPTYLYLY